VTCLPESVARCCFICSIIASDFKFEEESAMASAARHTKQNLAVWVWFIGLLFVFIEFVWRLGTHLIWTICFYNPLFISLFRYVTLRYGFVHWKRLIRFKIECIIGLCCENRIRLGSEWDQAQPIICLTCFNVDQTHNLLYIYAFLVFPKQIQGHHRLLERKICLE